jgi:hypothetical protein
MQSMVEGQVRLHGTARQHAMRRVPLHPAASRRGPPPRAKLGEEYQPSFSITASETS